MGKFIDVTMRLIDDFTKPLGNAMDKMQNSARQTIRAGKQIEGAGKSISSVGSTITKGVTLPIMGAATAAVKLASDFEYKMSGVQAITQATSSEFSALKDEAIKLGATTSFSAGEVADAMTEMAKAGWTTKDILSGMEGVLDATAASGENLGSVSTIIADAITGFGLKAKDSGMVADLLTQAANDGTIGINDLGETFKYIAPVAASMNMSISDVTTAVSAMSMAGIKGSSAGTALRTMLTNLVKPTNKMEEAMEKLGISISENGKMKSLDTIVNELRASFSGLTDEQKTYYAATLAGKEGMSGMLSLLNLSQKEYDKIAESMDNAGGVAKTTAEIMQDNLQSKVEQLGGAFESLSIKMSDYVLPALTDIVEQITVVVDWFTNLDDATQKSILKFGGISAAVGPAVFTFGKVTEGIGNTVEGFGRMGLKMKDTSKRVQDAKDILSKIQWPKLPKLNIPMPKAITNIGTIFKNIGGSAINSVAKIKTAASNFGSIVWNTKGLTSIRNIFSTIGSSKITKGILFPFNAIGKAIGGSVGGVGKLGKAFGGVGKAMFTVLGPAGTVIVILAALVAAGILVYKNWDKIKDAAQKVFNYVKNIVKKCGIDFDGMKEKTQELAAKFKVSWEKMKEGAKAFWNFIKPILSGIVDIFKIVIPLAIATVVSSFEGWFTIVSNIIGYAIDAFGGLGDFISNIFVGNWKEAWEGLKTFMSNMAKMIVEVIKTPFNALISLINGAINAINKIGITLPDWLPGDFGGKSFGFDLPSIPMLYTGTDDWRGGPAMVHDRGAEILDLPEGTRVIPHDKSLQMARAEGAKSASGSNITIAKLADSIIVREDADIDKIATALVNKLKKISENTGGIPIGNMA